MKKNVILLIIMGVLIVAGAFFIFRQNKTAASNDIILFYRNDCPHCAKVDAYITTNNIEQKIKFTRKEIHDQTNSDLLLQKAAACGIAQDSVGVPFLSVGNNCYMGEDQIEQFFSDQTK